MTQSEDERPRPLKGLPKFVYWLQIALVYLVLVSVVAFSVFVTPLPISLLIGFGIISLLVVPILWIVMKSVGGKDRLNELSRYESHITIQRSIQLLLVASSLVSALAIGLVVGNVLAAIITVFSVSLACAISIWLSRRAFGG